MGKQEEVPDDPCSGIWWALQQDPASRPEMMEMAESGRTRHTVPSPGAKLHFHLGVWSTQRVGSGRFPACLVRKPNHLLPGGEACAVIIVWEGHL